MEFNRQVSRALHADHLASIGLLGRVEQTLSRPGAAAGTGLAPLAAEFARFIGQDIDRHFAFEEGELFTRLADAGEGDIAGLLKEEHDAIRAVADDLQPLLRQAVAGDLAGDDLDALRRLALEMVERQVSHIQKETMALLPMLDDLLEDDDDARLAMAYASA